MRNLLWILLATLALLQSCSEHDPAGTPPAVSSPQVSISIADQVPAADPGASTFQDLQGNALELSDYAGKRVFLNYWATWCAPCIREIPAIARAAEILGNENFVFLLASDESPEMIRDFLEERDFEGNFIKLNGYFAGHGIEAVPSSMLYDESGVEIATWYGAYEWDSPELLSQLRGE